MSVPVVAFFNNKGGVGKTTLVYHLAWMMRDLGVGVLAADLDPQSNLTAAFFDEDALLPLWDSGQGTIAGAMRLMLSGQGDIDDAGVQHVTDRLSLLPGDLAFSSAEDEFAQQWPLCSDGKERAFRVMSSLWRIIQASATGCGASVVLLDLGPNLGAINRAALIAADYLVVPLAPDLFSLQGLRNLGPTLRQWRRQWAARCEQAPRMDIELPGGRVTPIGYVVQQHAVRLDRPVTAYGKWMERIPEVYHRAVLDEPGCHLSVDKDPACLAQLRHYHSLIPMAQEARKPLFRLRPADGARGAHFTAAKESRIVFEALASRILDRIQVTRQQ